MKTETKIKKILQKFAHKTLPRGEYTHNFPITWYDDTIDKIMKVTK